jgi:serine/threonine protein kinase
LENIMLDGQGRVKLVDLGLALPLRPPSQPLSPRGSLAYAPPELVKNRVRD